FARLWRPAERKTKRAVDLRSGIASDIVPHTVGEQRGLPCNELVISSCKACGAIVVTLLRAQELTLSGGSNRSRTGAVMVRISVTYTLRRHISGPSFVTGQR